MQRLHSGSAARPPQRAFRSRRDNSDSGHERPKALLSPIASLLRTGDPTDTVDRLFDSRHVNDLRLIAATAFCATIAVSIIAAMNVVSSCVAEWPPQHPDNVFQMIDYIVRTGGTHIGVFGSTLALFGTILAWAYQRGSSRLGVIDLFACEIDTLCRVITVTESMKKLTDDDGGSAIPDRFTSEENYFPILDGNSKDLQSLEANVVINITAFYTFMKTVRDTLRKGSEARGVDQRKESVKALVYVLYLALESARKAMDDLVEFEPTHTERTMVILLSELRAYTYLRQNYQDETEAHYNRLILRGPGYKRLMDELHGRLDNERDQSLAAVRRGNLEKPTYAQSQWAAALQLRSQLDKRFQELESKVALDCTTTDNQITTTITITANAA
jgi:hypothetical protein